MVEILHLGSLVPATVGVCCAVGDRRGSGAVGWAPALVMLVAMVDVMAGVGTLSPVVWAAVLAGLALWPAVALRRERGNQGSRRGHAESVATAMAVHSSASLLLMAALTLVAGATGATLGAAAMTEGAGGHSGHGAAVPVALALWVATAILVTFTVWLLVSLSRQPSGPRRSFAAILAPVESASMAVSIVMMTVALTAR